MSDIIWAIATYEITKTLSLNEVVRLVFGVGGIAFHVFLLGQAVHRGGVLKRVGLNGSLAHVAQSRIENESVLIVVQVLMFVPATVVMGSVTSMTAQTSWGVSIVWMQAAVSVILTCAAWRRAVRSAKLDRLLTIAR